MYLFRIALCGYSVWTNTLVWGSFAVCLLWCSCAVTVHGRFTSLFSTFISREGNMRSPQVFLPAALFCTVITHPDPHHQPANRKALPVSLCILLFRACQSLFSTLHYSMSCILWNHGSIWVLTSNNCFCYNVSVHIHWCLFEHLFSDLCLTLLVSPHYLLYYTPVL